MVSIQQLSLMVNQHLGFLTCTDDAKNCMKWKIFDSPLGGRGLIATDDIKSGEIVFVDHPLVYGPRSGTIVQRGCTVCRNIDSDTLYKCSKCALLLCSEQCQNSSTHLSDCSVISCWPNKVPIEDIDDTLMSRALTAVRALSLNKDQKNLLTSLQAHVLHQHGSEIRALKEYFDIFAQDEEFMTLVSCILDANAFQMAVPYGKKEMNLRGIYPVSSLMNHNCTSNTRYSFNAESHMTVRAVKPIRSGTEIFTCYSGMLWGTPARRLHLYKTKHFLCACERCSDPTERGTLLAALKCFSTECSGSLLPIEPLKSNSAWRCLECGLKVPFLNISTLQNALGSLMGSLDFDNIYELEKFFLNRITKYIPKTNQIYVDLQCRLIWELGETEGLHWAELSESRLELKESLCRGTLRTVAALGAGDAHLRGLLLYHLHAVLAERARRSPDLYEELKSEIETTIEQAYNILLGDISAPPDLELRREYLGPGCDKPHEERFFILDSPDRIIN
ncbi:SET domain-containing protein SmydA-8-like [Melitaea cinxia]|uniref:SET domain-containing protein SmydA-8-like n=1 Tax=Melitaea cinxia TaxID=113334 RepID=UPI001E272FCF|nr:SET domain-containing protein SmydA-8-like [Melitaea cinxia]